MKIIFRSVILTFLLISTIAQQSVIDSAKIYDMNSLDGKLKVSKNELFKLSIASNPTTGYQWLLLNPTTLLGTIDLIAEHYVSKKTGLLGSGGTQEFVFKAGNSKTDVDLGFVYARSWELELVKQGDDPSKFDFRYNTIRVSIGDYE